MMVCGAHQDACNDDAETEKKEGKYLRYKLAGLGANEAYDPGQRKKERRIVVTDS
jgi:hypothetical protein